MNEKEMLKKTNDSLMLLDKDLVKAIDDYFKRGHINIASIVGILNHHQYALNSVGTKINEMAQKKKDLSKVDYIG